MAQTTNKPTGIQWVSITPTSVRITWRNNPDIAFYELKGGGTEQVRRIYGNSTLIKGLAKSDRAVVLLRGVDGNGVLGEWEEIGIQTTVGIPVQPDYVGTIPLIDADRQSLKIRLPSATGGLIECRLIVWWQPSDAGWWAILEAPVNTLAVGSVRLALNCGILDGASGVLDGNIVMRATLLGGTDEPTRASFADKTHELRWEQNG